MGTITTSAAEPLNTGWTLPNMEIFMDANDLSAEAAVTANDYITIDLAQTYPVTFAL